MHLISMWVTKILNNLPTIYPIGIKFGLGNQCYVTKDCKLIFDTCFLFGSDNLFKKFEMLDGKSEVKYSWNENF